MGHSLITVNESTYIALLVVSGSTKKLFFLMCSDLSFLTIFFKRFHLGEKCEVTPHCLHRESLTLRMVLVKLSGLYGNSNQTTPS